MPDALYKIVFKGEIGFDFDEEEVKASLQKFCGFDRAAVDKLFSGKTIVLKKNLDEIKANNLCSSLQKLGALAMVVPMAPLADIAPSCLDESSSHLPGNEPVTFVCPACGLTQEKGESCIVCGVIFVKFARVQQRRAQELHYPPAFEASQVENESAGSRALSLIGQITAQPFLVRCGLLILALTGFRALLGPGLLSSGFIILPAIYLIFIMVRGMLSEQAAAASIAEQFNILWERVEPEASRRQWIPWGTYGVVLSGIFFYYGLVLHLDPAILWNHLAFVPAAPNVWNVPLSAIASMFLHAGGWPLWGSVIFLWAVGPQVEKRLGCRRFIGLYLLAGLVAGGAGALLHPLFLQGPLHNLGSSGAIAGIIGFFIAQNTDRSMEFSPPLLDMLQYVAPLQLTIRLDSLAFIGMFFYSSLGVGNDPQAALAAVLLGHLIHAVALLVGLALGQMFRSSGSPPRNNPGQRAALA